MTLKENRWSLFEVFGVEMEYMIVKKGNLEVHPICDQLLKEYTGEICSDLERGPLAWSNELVCHVLEIKANGPANSLSELIKPFHENVLEANKTLARYDSMLLPTGAHPWMDPFKEMVIWPHENNEIYSLYNKIFDCRGHGWSNLQSTHINLPFKNEKEFGMLHAAIRAILPLIPGLSSSTPLLDGKLTGFKDSRLEVYRHNQKKIPSIGGAIIPEGVFTQSDYHHTIFDPIVKDISPYDEEGVLDKHFLNSRGAIARFDRGAIEIRIIDLQECPLADLSLLALIVEVLKGLTEERWSPLREQKKLETSPLADLFIKAIKEGEEAQIENLPLLKVFGFSKSPMNLKEFWSKIFEKCPFKGVDPILPETAKKMIQLGSLSSRIIKALGPSPDRKSQEKVYRDLAHSLVINSLFLPSH